MINQQETNSLLRKAGGKPLVISGPCSAETQAQLMATAMALQSTGAVDILRAGIWKPRTRPGSFEGAGSRGLPWLTEARRLTGLPVAVEIANSRQVEQALKYGIDVLWIGARTTANPFSVQEIADTLLGVDVPVLVKNPVNPDIELWLGAVERLAIAGVKEIGLIHRGFSSCYRGAYRNAPMWQLAMQMKNKFPHMVLLNDPSHISGKRDLIPEIIKKAFALSFDGFMIESHIDPVNAWSDADQQISPGELAHLLQAIFSGSRISRSQGFSLEEFLIQERTQLMDELQVMGNKRIAIEEQLRQYKPNP